MARGRSNTAVAHQQNGATEQKQVTLKQMLAEAAPRLKNLLPDYIAPERYLSLAMLAVARNPMLQKAAQEAPETIVDSVLRAAQLGLEIGGAVPGAHLVPFNNKVPGTERSRMECQLIPDYRGLIGLAVDSGALISGDARVVFKGEHFKVFYGTEERIEHEPAFDAIDAGEIVAAYFIGVLPNGTKKFEVMTKKQIDSIRAKSKAKDAMAWSQNFSEMAKKTVTKRGLKYVPMSPNNAAARKLALALEQDNRVESGRSSGIVPEWGDDEASMSAESRAATRERLDNLRHQMTGRDVGEGETKNATGTKNATEDAAEEERRRFDLMRKTYEQALKSARPDLVGDDFETTLNRREWISGVVGHAEEDKLELADYKALVKALNEPREPGSDDE